MSLLQAVNVFIFQWFFFRLAKVVDKDNHKILRWTILDGIVPMTGWKDDYVYLKGGELTAVLFIRAITVGVVCGSLFWLLTLYFFI